MKITVLLVILSSLFAIGHLYNFTNNPECTSPLQTGNEKNNTFVLILDHYMPWKYRERMMYLLKHMICVIPPSYSLPIVVMMFYNNGSQWEYGTSWQIPKYLTRNPNPGVTGYDICGRFQYLLDQVNGIRIPPYMNKNIQFLVPIIPETDLQNCSMIDMFRRRLIHDDRRDEFHFNGILVNGNWSEEKKREHNIIIDIPDINVIDPQVTSMTSDENIDYVVKTAAIVQQVNNFFNRVIGVRPTTTTTTEEPETTRTTTIRTTTEEMTTTTEDDYIADEYVTDTTTPTVISEAFASNIQPKTVEVEEDQNDILRDYFWHIVIILVIIIIILNCILIASCIWCLGRNKKKSRASSSSSSSSSRRHPSKEPLLTPKKKKPVIVPQQQAPLVKHDEIDEWNQIRPGSRENEGVSAEPVEEPVKLDYGEMKISERQMTDGNDNEQQGATRVKRGYHKNQTPTGFSFE